jgi:hypothetical protein
MLKEYFQKVTLPIDKANHAFQGLLIYSLIALYSPFVALVVVLAVGVGKEILDSKIGGTVDGWDTVATVAAPIGLYVVGLFV